MKFPPLPATLAGFQLLCNSKIADGDLLVLPTQPGEPYCWAFVTIGQDTDDNGHTPDTDGRNPAGFFRVYRKIPVPTPGGTDTNPSTGKPFEVSTPAVHHSAPAPRASEVEPVPVCFQPATPAALSGISIIPPGVQSLGIAATADSAKEFAAACAPRSALPTVAAARKGIPIATGCLDYFPDALAEVARLSKVGNDQHNPGQPLHWDKSKSTDEADALLRHLIDRGTRDTDGMRHSAKVAWRSLALLQREIDAERKL